MKPSAASKIPHIFYGYIIVFVAFFVMPVAMSPQGTYGLFFIPMSTELNWTRAMTSGAFSIHIILVGLFSIGVGRLNDKLGPRVVITICGAFLGLGFLLISRISALWQLYLLFGIMMPLGPCGGWIPLVSTVARWFKKRRGTMTSIILAGGGTVAIIMPPVVAWLISVYGWRESYTILGITALVIMILGAQFLRRDPAQMGLSPYGEEDETTEAVIPKANVLSMRQVLATRQFWMLAISFLCAGFSMEVLTVHFVPHVTDLKFSMATAATILAIGNAIGIPGRLMLGIAADRIGNKVILVISYSLLIAALFWLLVSRETWMLYTFQVVRIFGSMGIIILMSPIVADLFGLTSHGMIMGSITFIWSIGSALGPLLAGYIHDIYGSYQIAFILSAIINIIALILVMLMRPLPKE